MPPRSRRRARSMPRSEHRSGARSDEQRATSSGLGRAPSDSSPARLRTVSPSRRALEVRSQDDLLRVRPVAAAARTVATGATGAARWARRLFRPARRPGCCRTRRAARGPAPPARRRRRPPSPAGSARSTPRPSDARTRSSSLAAATARRDELVGEVPARPGVDADGEVGADVAERAGRVEVPAGQVEAVARSQRLLEQRRSRGGLLDGGAPVGPRLVAQRARVDRLADPPALLAGHLEDEDVVNVVVVAEAGVLRRRDVGVDLHRVTEVGGEVLGEGQHRLPGAVQALQHDRRAVGEEPQQLVVARLVGDARAGPAAGRERAVGQGRPVLRDPQERGAEAAPRDELVDGVVREQVAEPARQVRRAAQQRPGSPVLPGRTRRPGTRDQAPRVRSARP